MVARLNRLPQSVNILLVFRELPYERARSALRCLTPGRPASATRSIRHTGSAFPARCWSARTPLSRNPSSERIHRIRIAHRGGLVRQPPQITAHQQVPEQLVTQMTSGEARHQLAIFHFDDVDNLGHAPCTTPTDHFTHPQLPRRSGFTMDFPSRSDGLIERRNVRLTIGSAHTVDDEDAVKQIDLNLVSRQRSTVHLYPPGPSRKCPWSSACAPPARGPIRRRAPR